MKIKPFAVEEWMNRYEVGAKHNIAETCVDSVSASELFALTGEDAATFWERFSARRLTYGDIEGAPEFKQGVCGLYKTVKPGEVIPCHGAAGANHHLFYSLVEPGDRVVSIAPSYQQLTSIPESFGADVRVLPLRPENGWLPDVEELRALCTADTKLICINNPNNPTGALMDGALLRQIVEIAGDCGAWLLCDEVYRHLTQEDGWSESIVDLYDKGISVSSMSKVFSLAGLRLGWIATHDAQVREAVICHRDYDLISCGMFDEALAAVALRHKDKVLARNRAVVRDNLKVLDAWIASEPRVSYVRPKSGTTALVSYDYDLDSRSFCDRMYRETGAFVVPGDCFGVEKSMRIGYANNGKTLREGLDAVSAFLRQLEREGK